MTQVLTAGSDFGPFCINGASPIPFNDFVTKLDHKFFIGQGGFAENIPAGYSTKINLIAARAAGIPLVGEYYWLDAEDNIQATIDFWSKDIDSNRPDFCEYDLEQDRNQSIIYSDKQITNFVTGVIFGMEARYPQLQHSLYSRPDFIRTSCPSLIPWLKTRAYPWWAANPGYGLPTYYLSYDDIKAGVMKVVTNYNTVPYSWKWANVYNDNLGPDMSLSASGGHWLWQCGGNRRAIGTIWEYDWNYWQGDFASMWAWAKKTTPIPTPPTWQQSIDTWARTLGYNGPKP